MLLLFPVVPLVLGLVPLLLVPLPVVLGLGLVPLLIVPLLLGLVVLVPLELLAGS